MASIEPSPIEYALRLGLFINSKSYISNETMTILDNLRKSTAITEATEDLPAAEIPDPLFHPEADLRGRNVEEILAEAIGVKKKDNLMDLAMEASFSHFRFVSAVHKLELPLLRSDPRHDFKALSKTISETKLHDFFQKPSNLVHDPVDVKNDEAMEFPPTAVHFHSQLTKGPEPEDIGFTEESFAYVDEFVYEDFTNDDLQGLISQEIDPRRERNRSLTPLLILPSPDSRLDTDVIPTREVCNVESLSDVESLFGSDLNTAESLMNDLYMAPDLPETSFLDSAELFSDTAIIGLFTPKDRVQDLILEAPSFQPLKSGPSTAQADTVCRDLISSMPGVDSAVEFKLSEQTMNQDDLEFNEKFAVFLQTKADELTSISEQEQIHVVDATARFQPPAMDFNIPVPEWLETTGEASQMFSWIRHRNKSQFESSLWPKNPMETRELRWVPFSSRLAGVDTEESINDDGILQRILEIPGAPLLTSEDFVRKPTRLKVLSEESGSELPIQSREEDPWIDTDGSRSGIMDLVRKRKSQLMEEDDVEVESPTVQHKSQRMINRRNAVRNLGGSLLLGEDEPHAAGKLLANFMELQGSKNTMSRSKRPSYPAREGLTTNPRVYGTKTRSPQKLLKQVAPQARNEVTGVVPPSPPIGRLEGPAQVIISITLSRSMINALKSNLPGIDLVDRDLSRYDTWSWSPGSTSRMQKVSPLSYEADIIPSPSTGIIITTLLKLRQQPLPGSNSKINQLRERVIKVAPLYERLVILVSEGSTLNEEHIGSISQADAEAYTCFVSFALALGTSVGCCVRVIYVGGGNKTLETWTCALVSAKVNENPPSTRQLLMAEETEWELFLRHAGFNMYAAQVVIAILKGKYGEKSEDSPLSQFLKMAPATRWETFGKLLSGAAGGGARSVVDRVNARLG
ncbi:uncharacterized protein CTRU02_212441 [Colletotrichum truncatum]|uniref:Uncharacterized protein n=1 Tax=Colletotrichum truncatum TaxID=5467 RepID=A0ACC3YNJ4_COLTU|nr:uncharacterized protein CTRU02_08689 [Colletotrichum truncatum]KAF6789442.1 hypothetical protein CTRU02_08689 [Colletotrichum truncatum]